MCHADGLESLPGLCVSVMRQVLIRKQEASWPQHSRWLPGEPAARTEQGRQVPPGQWFSDLSVTQSPGELLKSERGFGGPGIAVLTSSQVTLMEPLVWGLICWA